MSVASKLQIKPGHRVAVLRAPATVDLELAPDSVVEEPASAGAAVVFVMLSADLDSSEAEAVVALAKQDALAWVAYPKAGRLGTDLNRDSLAAHLAQRGVRPVRQVSIDDTWSALRFRPAT